MNNPIISIEIEAVIKNLPKKQKPRTRWLHKRILSNICCCLVTSVVSDSVRPHRRQPTRPPHPWDSPGKNTGVGCHFLLQCMKVKSESKVAQSCPTLSDPMGHRLPGSSFHGIFQARVLEWGAIAFSNPTFREELMIILKLKKLQRKEHFQTHSTRPPSP